MQEDEAMELGPLVPRGWDKEQADLLRRIALAGGSYAAENCHSPPLEALIATGFVKMLSGDRVTLTEVGLARARELRSPPIKPPTKAR